MLDSTQIIVGVALLGYYFVRWYIRAGRNKKANNTLSLPAQVIMKAYNKLPEDSQRAHDLEPKLKMLDEQLGINEVNKHFQETQRDYSGDGSRFTKVFTWDMCSNRLHGYSMDDNGICKYRVYKDINNEIKALQSAVDKRAAAEQRAGIDAVGVNTILEDIRQERSIVEQVTKELS